MKGKLKFIVPLALLVLLGGAYKTVLAKPKAEPKPKVDGQVYVLPKEFLLNTSDDRYAKLWVALVLPESETLAAKAEGAKPPEGFGTLTQEAIVRSLVGDVVGAAKGSEIESEAGRAKLQKRLLKAIKEHTDVHAEDVVFTDVVVQ